MKLIDRGKWIYRPDFIAEFAAISPYENREVRGYPPERTIDIKHHRYWLLPPKFFLNIESGAVVMVQFFSGPVLGWITEDFGGEAELKYYLKQELEQLTGMIVNRIVVFALDGPLIPY